MLFYIAIKLSKNYFFTIVYSNISALSDFAIFSDQIKNFSNELINYASILVRPTIYQNHW